MRLRFLLFILIFSANAYAEDSVAADQSCPNKQKLKNMCMLIGNHTRNDVNSGRYPFMFQQRFADAACLKDTDSKEQVIEKIGPVWQLGQEGYMQCTGFDFEVLRGNILKYAVAKKFDEFIDQAIEWKVDLNKVDASDGRTVLDYINYYIDKNKGNNMEMIYQMYYSKFRKAGAKSAAELK